MADTALHVSHCCPVHGCKYGSDSCPVFVRGQEPMYPGNNGCEQCQDAKDAASELESLRAEAERLRAENRRLKGDAAGEYDVAVVVFARVEASDYGEAETIAQRAIHQLVRDHAEKHRLTGTMSVYARHGERQFGPVKIAKVTRLNEGSYETGITRKPNNKNYRFWDLTPEQIDAMNEEAMGG